MNIHDFTQLLFDFDTRTTKDKKLLGAGLSSKVYEVDSFKNHLCPVAIKLFSEIKIDLKLFYREIYIMNLMRHPCTTELFGFNVQTNMFVALKVHKFHQ